MVASVVRKYNFSNKHMYLFNLRQDCDIVIKRHLWRDNQSLFGDEVSPHLSQYIKEKEAILYSNEGAASISASLSLTASSSGIVNCINFIALLVLGFHYVWKTSRRGGPTDCWASWETTIVTPSITSTSLDLYMGSFWRCFDCFQYTFNCEKKKSLVTCDPTC